MVPNSWGKVTQGGSKGGDYLERRVGQRPYHHTRSALTQISNKTYMGIERGGGGNSELRVVQEKERIITNEKTTERLLYYKMRGKAEKSQERMLFSEEIAKIKTGKGEEVMLKTS